MSTNRIVRIVVGLALIGYGVYSSNAWFYLGVMPLVTGLINWCPLEMKMGTCNPESGCCATPSSKDNGSACCSTSTDDKSSDACCATSSEDESSSACCSTSVPAENASSCCATPSVEATEVAKQANSFSFSASKKGKIEVLGTGCKKCKELEMAAQKAVDALESDYEVLKVEDVQVITNYGVTSTPALVIDGVVKTSGRVLSVDEIKILMTENKS